MSVSQISTRYSTAITLLQAGQDGAAKPASGNTNDLIKIANGLSTTPGFAAKQASGIAFGFAVTQAQRDEARKADLQAGQDGAAEPASSDAEFTGQRDGMSVSQGSTRYTETITFAEPGQEDWAGDPATRFTNDLIKAANSLSTTQGSAAKQASGFTFSYTVTQAQRDEARKEAEAPMSIVMAGIGGGEAVERFDSWDAVRTRIRTDRTMGGGQMSEWSAHIDWWEKVSEDIRKYQLSDLGIAQASGEYQRALDAAMEEYLANSTPAAGMTEYLKQSATLVRSILRPEDLKLS